MAIKVDSALVLELEINGMVYKLREPSVGQMRDFTKAIKKESNDNFDLMIGLLCDLGLDEKIVNSLSVKQLKQIFDAIIGELTEKK